MVLYETQLKADAFLPVSEVIGEWLRLNSEMDPNESSFDLYWWDYDDASFTLLSDHMAMLASTDRLIHEGEVVVRVLRPSD